MYFYHEYLGLSSKKRCGTGVFEDQSEPKKDQIRPVFLDSVQSFKNPYYKKTGSVQPISKNMKKQNLTGLLNTRCH